MSYEQEPSPPNHETVNRLINELHGETELNIHGRTFTLNEANSSRRALCPKEPDPVKDLEFTLNALEKSEVPIDDEIKSLLTQVDPQIAKRFDKQTNALSESKKQTTETVEKDEARAPKSAEKVTINTSGSIETLVKNIPKVPAVIMAKLVELEIKPNIIRPIREENKPSVKKADIESAAQDIPAFEVTQSVVNVKIDKITTPNQAVAELVEKADTVMMPTSEMVVNLVEIDQIEASELMTEEFTDVPLVGTEFNTFDGELAQKIIPVEAIADETVETEFLVVPERSEVYEEVEKTPAVVVAEFMLQVLPAFTQEVYERVQEMEPEAAAEVATQIESISIVADRLHVLVLEGNTEGEEAKQIEAYLKREYEQLLLAVGIEPTEEILNDFIRYIYSAEYQVREDIDLKKLEIIDEGTHEKKLFDEQGVFSRAHAASVNLSRRLDKSIGRLVVNYFS